MHGARCEAPRSGRASEGAGATIVGILAANHKIRDMRQQPGEPSGFCIGHLPTLRLRVTHLEGHGEEWCGFRAEATAFGFKADFNFDAEFYEFAAFADQVREMDKTLKGAVQFENHEGNVSIDGRIDHLGHISWSIALRSQAHFGEAFPELTFRMEGDQTMLKTIAAQIDHMIQAAQTAIS